MPPDPPGLELRGVSKSYPGGISGISGVDLVVDSAELLALVGPSGSGKSTLLRAVAGLEAIDSGEVRIGGKRVDDRPPKDRNAALVFQNQAPYPYLSVFDNLAFGLRARRRPKAEVRERVLEVADALRLSDLLKRRPSALSGGEKQRVALGRALASRPALLLLDEPFSNLDTPLRVSARGDLLVWQRRWGITTLLVTHDQAEALAIGDRVAVMDRGKIVQVGPPREVYGRPATPFVAGFLGSPPRNLIECRLDRQESGAILTPIGLGPGSSPIAVRDGILGSIADRFEPGSVLLGIQADDVLLTETGAVDGVNAAFQIPVILERLEYQGSRQIATLKAGQARILAQVDDSATFSVGSALTATVALSRAAWFRSEMESIRR